MQNRFNLILYLVSDSKAILKGWNRKSVLNIESWSPMPIGEGHLFSIMQRTHLDHHLQGTGFEIFYQHLPKVRKGQQHV